MFLCLALDFLRVMKMLFSKRGYGNSFPGRQPLAASASVSLLPSRLKTVFMYVWDSAVEFSLGRVHTAILDGFH